MLSVAGYGGHLCAIVTKHRCCLPLPPAGMCVERLADACDPYNVIDSGLGAHCPVGGRLLKKPEESSYLMTHSLYSWPWHPKLSGTYTPMSSHQSPLPVQTRRRNPRTRRRRSGVVDGSIHQITYLQTYFPRVLSPRRPTREWGGPSPARRSRPLTAKRPMERQNFCW